MHAPFLPRFGILLAALVPALPAQTARTQAELQASYDAHKGDFDYLLGDWEFTAERRDSAGGKVEFHGCWTAARLGQGGQILDEYRVLGDDGETYYCSTTLRAYNAVLDRWELISSEGADGLQDFGTARIEGGEMHIEQRFGVTSPEPSTWRIRYYDIQPDRFEWTADRSTDDGKTWVKDHMQIHARRVGPARTLGPFTPAAKAGR